YVPGPEEPEQAPPSPDYVPGPEHDDDEIYTRLDDEQGQRQLLAGRVNMLFRDRRTHAHTRQLMEIEAGMSREAWGRAMDASCETPKMRNIFGSWVMGVPRHHTRL
ncbi:hypothetical protein Tco_0538977, partial [Tanacetum coccineum]